MSPSSGASTVTNRILLTLLEGHSPLCPNCVAGCGRRGLRPSNTSCLFLCVHFNFGSRRTVAEAATLQYILSAYQGATLERLDNCCQSSCSPKSRIAKNDLASHSLVHSFRCVIPVLFGAWSLRLPIPTLVWNTGLIGAQVHILHNRHCLERSRTSGRAANPTALFLLAWPNLFYTIYPVSDYCIQRSQDT